MRSVARRGGTRAARDGVARRQGDEPRGARRAPGIGTSTSRPGMLQVDRRRQHRGRRRPWPGASGCSPGVSFPPAYQPGCLRSIRTEGYATCLTARSTTFGYTSRSPLGRGSVCNPCAAPSLSWGASGRVASRYVPGSGSPRWRAERYGHGCVSTARRNLSATRKVEGNADTDSYRRQLRWTSRRTGGGCAATYSRPSGAGNCLAHRIHVGWGCVHQSALGSAAEQGGRSLGVPRRGCPARRGWRMSCCRRIEGRNWWGSSRMRVANGSRWLAVDVSWFRRRVG